MHNLTPFGKTVVISLTAIALIILTVIVAGNDRGSQTEVSLLNGSQCDAMYHAVWKVQAEPSHSTLIDIAKSQGCPFEE